MRRASDADALWRSLDARAQVAPAILELFSQPDRAEDFSIRAEGLLFDYSKTRIERASRADLLALARVCGVGARRDAMFAGAHINETEDRAVLHVALRAPAGCAWADDEALETLARMGKFADALRAGSLKTPAGAIFTDVINIGIGGSDLGPAMATRALSPYHDGPRLHYVSNIDSADISDTIQSLDPSRTLVIIASKTFTTQETMQNAATARAWISAAGLRPEGHFVALSSARDRVAAWGIAPERCFGFADWVGGRYSLWGPIGLGLMLAIGPARFGEMLAGAHAMDLHFRTARGAGNLPLMLALTGIWHRQILGYGSRAIIPYAQRLERLPAYLQQLEMESNGKSVAMDGSPLTRPSSPVIWGAPGTNGQHAFFQMLHQGSDVVPVEFLLARQGHEPELARHHMLLAANCLAQSEALMRGRPLEAARALMAGQGLKGEALERAARHRVFAGNRPSTILLFERLTPYTLGQIIALYEHRVFVEGVILGLNSFDQWGVELGKELANTLVPILEGSQDASDKDGSTRMLARALQTPPD